LKRKTNKKISPIKLIVFDVDGVLTDGGYYFNEEGKVTKKYCGRDIDSLRTLSKEFKVIFLTGSKKINQSFGAYVGIETYNSDNKFKFLKKYCQENKFGLQDTLFIGDAPIDLECIDRVGYCMCPSDAERKVKDKVIEKKGFVLIKKGGEGIVEEVIELLTSYISN